MRKILRCLLAVVGVLPVYAQVSPTPSDHDWPIYGGDAGGQRYSQRTQIDKTNVASLQPAWTFHTGFFKTLSPDSNHRANFEATPVLWHDTLYFDTPFDTVFAIDAATGQQRWTYDPAVDREGRAYIVTSRGVALWHGKGPAGATCGQHRVFVATLDRRLIARDALSGKACENFGVHGSVDLTAGFPTTMLSKLLLGYTSPPTVVGDVVVIGSSIGDNMTIATANGAVRGFDVRSGRQIWSWDPIPWAGQKDPHTGSGNAWSILSADPARDLIYIPTGSPATDFYGGLRVGDNRDADSIVALRASTGQRVWAFQLVHHDIWDYDTPSEPLLFTFRNSIPAVAVTTKTGMVFVFNRVTGEPLYPITERPVPQTDLPGEVTSLTQPFSSLPTLTPLGFKAEDIVLKDPAEQEFCRKAVGAVVNKGIFTPPSQQATLLYPGSLGGANWGSPGFDPVTGMLYVHTNSFAYAIQQKKYNTSFTGRALDYAQRHTPDWLKPAPNDPHTRFKTPDGGELTPQWGTPYQLSRLPITTPGGVPCAPQPYGGLVAINLNTGTKLWSVPQGTMLPGQHTGAIGMGGPAVTASGLVFIGATVEPLFRAFDAANGKLLWEHTIPAPASATPMTYQIGGRQFVVVAAGGEGMLGDKQDDTIVAFALPVLAARTKPAKPLK